MCMHILKLFPRSNYSETCEKENPASLSKDAQEMVVRLGLNAMAQAFSSESPGRHIIIMQLSWFYLDFVIQDLTGLESQKLHCHRFPDDSGVWIYLENTRWTRITWISPLCTAKFPSFHPPHTPRQSTWILLVSLQQTSYELTSCRERPNLLQDTQKNPGTLPHISDFLSCFIKKKKCNSSTDVYCQTFKHYRKSL